MKKKHATTGDDADEVGRVDPIAVRTALGRVWAWAYDPANLTNSWAADVRVLIEQARRLADRGPDIERLHTDLAIARSANIAYRRKLARMRAELEDARRAVGSGS